MGRSTCLQFAFAAFVVSCSTTPATHPSFDAGVVDSGSERDGRAGTAGCHSDPGGELVCARAKVSGVPWGAEVTGTIVPGDYQLVSETLYGSPEPNTTSPNAGDRVKRVLNVDCDGANELYTTQSAAGHVATTIPTSVGNLCRILDPQPLSLLSVSGVMGPGIQDLQDHVAYTAHGETPSPLSPHAARRSRGGRHDLKSWI
jgi:hypothetical protein